jgi:hypothetical protein
MSYAFSWSPGVVVVAALIAVSEPNVGVGE